MAPTPHPQTPYRLSNQGATCYLNSLIQTLYMTPEFRRALYARRFRSEEKKGDGYVGMDGWGICVNTRVFCVCLALPQRGEEERG